MKKIFSVLLAIIPMLLLFAVTVNAKTVTGEIADVGTPVYDIFVATVTEKDTGTSGRYNGIKHNYVYFDNGEKAGSVEVEDAEYARIRIGDEITVFVDSYGAAKIYSVPADGSPYVKNIVKADGKNYAIVDDNETEPELVVRFGSSWTAPNRLYPGKSVELKYSPSGNVSIKGYTVIGQTLSNIGFILLLLFFVGFVILLIICFVG